MAKRKLAETASKSSKPWSATGKRKRNNVQTKECVICVETKPLYRNFPTFTACSHRPDTCSACIAKQTVTLLEASREKGWTVCRCPQCDVSIPPQELQGALPRAVVRGINEMIDKAVKTTHDSWRWCLAVGCGHGSLQDGRKDMIKCGRCEYKMCFKHQVPWHHGYTCQEYETSHPQVAVTKTNEDMVKIISRPCPGCGIAVEKVGGCNQMRCMKCGESWAWDTVTLLGGDPTPARRTWLDLLLGAPFVAGGDAHLLAVGQPLSFNNPAIPPIFQPVVNFNFNPNPLPLHLEGHRGEVHQRGPDHDSRPYSQNQPEIQPNRVRERTASRSPQQSLVAPSTLVGEPSATSTRGPATALVVESMAIPWVAQGGSAQTAIDLTGD